MNNSTEGKRGHAITEQMLKFLLKDLCASKAIIKRKSFSICYLANCSLKKKKKNIFFYHWCLAKRKLECNTFSILNLLNREQRHRRTIRKHLWTWKFWVLKPGWNFECFSSKMLNHRSQWHEPGCSCHVKQCSFNYEIFFFGKLLVSPRRT